MKETIFVPPIKSQGIKTKLVPWIKKLVPEDFCGTWIEPFMGTGVVGFNVAARRSILCDTNPHLINFYNGLKSGEISAAAVKNHLQTEGNKLLLSEGAWFYDVRERFNRQHDPLDFLFLNRSCFNGMIRFNGKGGFNVPFCRKPNRFAQAYVTKISNQVERIAAIIKKGNYEFICQPFADTISLAQKNDLIYCDPPYIGRHADYFNARGHDEELALSEALNNTVSEFIMSTWHHNDYRENEYIALLWDKFDILTRAHFYHVGASEKNRSPMIEALITNIAKSRDKAMARTDREPEFLEG